MRENESGIVFEKVDHEVSYEEEMNQGQPVLPARVEFGSEKRRRKPDTTKINRPDMGIMMIAQGDPSRFGHISSQAALNVFGEALGGELDDKIQNNLRVDSSVEDKNRLVEQLVKDEFEAAYEKLGDSLRLQAQLIEGLDSLGVRTSVVKHVDMPDGGRKAFIGTIGNNRVYIVRGDQFQQISKDDSALEMQRSAKFIDDEQFGRIDQAMNPAQLGPEDRKWVGLDSDVGSVRSSAKQQNPRIRVFDVEPGDRIVIASGTLQRTLLEREMRLVAQRGMDDSGTERALQGLAERVVAKKNPRGRAELGEMAASVFTIPERRKLSGEEQERREREAQTRTLEATSDHHGKETFRLRQLVGEFQRRLAGPEAPRLERDRLKLLIEQARVQKEAEGNAYQEAEAELRILDLDIPPKLAIGSDVFLGLRKKTREPVRGQVISYDNETHEYIVQAPRGEVRRSRAQLESRQPGIMPDVGDRIRMRGKNGDAGYEIMGLREDNRYELLRRTEKGVVREVWSVDEVRTAMIRQLRESQQLLEEKSAAQQGYRSSHARAQDHERTLESVLRMEARHYAERGPSPDEEVQIFDRSEMLQERASRMREEVEELRRLIDRHDELDRRRTMKALGGREEAERKRLVVALHAESGAGVSGAKRKLEEMKQDVAKVEEEISRAS